jgi:hypothetical protein
VKKFVARAKNLREVLASLLEIRAELKRYDDVKEDAVAAWDEYNAAFAAPVVGADAGGGGDEAPTMMQHGKETWKKLLDSFAVPRISANKVAASSIFREMQDQVNAANYYAQQL